ncbi:integrase [Pseudomonas fluorescens]|uniref:integrase n=1 Tax=Pseudomonas fluorescens TaxID=294 RepID=UPI00054C79F7|nr:integrase [Pseudomonas fluorescens]KII37172.1 integrase [Pseudomonas fluorescens]
MITQFRPNREISTQHNLTNFIAMARDKLTLWSDIDGFAWDSCRWPTNKSTIRFFNFENRDLPPRKAPETHQMMHPAFVDVAKAYLRYTNTVRPQSMVTAQMRALRVIEFVLRNDMPIPDITKFEERHWNAIINTVEDLPSRAAICAKTLNVLNKLAELFILTADPRFWTNPYVGMQSDKVLNRKKTLGETGSDKVPDQDALLAIAEVFSQGTSETQNHTDVMVTCVTGLLMSAPMRIGETLRLRIDCLRDDIDKNGERQYYFAYWVPKSRQFARKAVPLTMTPVAIESIKRLSEITEESRCLARYMETEPQHFYRHSNCPNIADDDELSKNQLMQALGYSTLSSCRSFIKKLTGNSKLTGFTLDSLWQVVLKEHHRINPHFPYQEPPRDSKQAPLRMSESLMCFRRYQLTWSYKPSPVLLIPYTNGTYGSYLETGDAKAKIRNFFRRNGYSTIKVNSHSFRHLLNRLGRNNGISVEMLTQWSSRATIQQTRTYLYDDPIKAAVKGAVLLGSIQEQEPLKPITNEDAELYGQGPFHRSRYGICRRSWRAGPCNKFADCLNCSELLMCKGDKIAAQIIQMDRDNLVCTYTAALHAIAQGERAASRWTEKAGPQIEKLDELLAILHNPEIPNGSPIEIAGEDFSHEKLIVSEKAQVAGIKLLERHELRSTYGDDLLACLELLRSNDNA